MKYLLLVLCTGAALPKAYAPQAMYGVARILLFNSSCQFSLADGGQPAGQLDYVQENGKARRFADEATLQLTLKRY